MINKDNFSFYTQHFVYKNICFLISPLFYREYVCNVCDVKKYTQVEKAFVFGPYKDIVSLGFRNGTFCTTCAKAFIANPDKFIFEHYLGLLTKK